MDREADEEARGRRTRAKGGELGSFMIRRRKRMV